MLVTDKDDDFQFDNNMTKEIKKDFDVPFRAYGNTKVNGRWVCVSCLIDAKGRVSAFKQHYADETELEFAQDTLKKVLSQNGVRY